MDYINIPDCALLRHGTVISRIKSDFSRSNSSSCACPDDKILRDSTNSEAVRRLSLCEQCSRTKSNSQFSECSSELVNKCRPYRSRSARSRYVNVYAAVCLLLLAGELHQSSVAAAPYKSRFMEYTKRLTNEIENQLWGNPCDLAESADGEMTVEYKSSMAQNVVTVLNNALSYVDEYKNEFASYLGSESYDELMYKWKGYDWMDKWANDQSWVTKEIKPRIDMDEADGRNMTDLVEHIDDHLTNFHKGLKLVLAAMHKLSSRQLPNGANPNTDLQAKLKKTRDNVKNILCEFTELLEARKVMILPLYDSEVPELSENSKVMDTILIFRDTINYMKHLKAILEALAEKDNNVGQ